MTDPRRFYVVRGAAPHGTVTYKCPTPEWAVRKYRDLTKQEMTDVTITAPDGQVLTVAELEAASDESVVHTACVQAHQS